MRTAINNWIFSYKAKILCSLQRIIISLKVVSSRKEAANRSAEGFAGDGDAPITRHAKPTSSWRRKAPELCVFALRKLRFEIISSEWKLSFLRCADLFLPLLHRNSWFIQGGPNSTYTSSHSYIFNLHIKLTYPTYIFNLHIQLTYST